LEHDEDYGEGINPDILRQQVDQLTPAAKKLVAEPSLKLTRRKNRRRIMDQCQISNLTKSETALGE
jgi:hypothetical protein